MYLPTSPLGTAITTPSNAPAWAEATVPSIPQLVVSTGDSQLQRWSSLIGIITAIVGNVLISFALNIQRYAHIRLHKERSERREKARNAAKALQRGYGTTREDGPNGNQTIEENGHDDEEPDDPLQQSFHSTDSQSTAYSDSGQKPDSSYLQSPYWWGGIVLMAIGEAGNFLAYGFAPASIVSPLGVVALISNCVIAPIMLKEHFRLRDFWGVVIAVAGAVTVVLSAKQQERKLGPHEIWGAITTTEFEVYMAITIILTGGLMSASPKYGRRTILIDLGLVGLFGTYAEKNLDAPITNVCRWIYGSFNKRGCIDAFFYTLESFYDASHLCTPGRTYRYCPDASQIHQQGLAALRLYASYSSPVCHVHSVSYYWECNLISRFREGHCP